MNKTVNDRYESLKEELVYSSNKGGLYYSCMSLDKAYELEALQCLISSRKIDKDLRHSDLAEALIFATLALLHK